MDLNTLRIFKAIVDSGSFFKAASELRIQPAVITRKIAQLEKDLDEKLMTRSRKGVFMTEAGEEIYKLASGVETLEHESVSNLQSQTNSLQGDIKIYTTTGVINSWIIPAAADFLEVHPDVNLYIWGTNDPLEFADHTADVVVGPLKKGYESLEKIPIRSYHLKIYASKKYLDKFGTPKDFEDLDNHRLISFSNGKTGAFGDVDWFLTGKNGLRKPYMNVNSSHGLLNAAKLGLGIVYLGKEFVEENAPELVDLFPGDSGEKQDVYYIFHKNMKSFKRIVSFGNFLHNRFDCRKRM